MKILAIILCLCFVSTIAHALPDKVVQELWMRQVADNLSSSKDWDEAVARTREYVYSRMKTRQGADPYENLSMYERLQTGVGWCNHQVDAFMLLVSYEGITSRMVYLLNDKGESPHTIAEIYDGKNWVIVDVGNNLDLRKDGKMVTREDLKKDFTILTENDRVKELAKQDPTHWGNNDYLKMYTNEAKIVKVIKADRWQLGERRRF